MNCLILISIVYLVGLTLTIANHPLVVSSESKSTCDGKRVNVTYSDRYYIAVLTPASTPKTRFCILTHPVTVDKIVSKRIQNKGFYGDAYLFERIFLANDKKSFFLDAGANIGFHTLQAAAVGIYNVISWEPNPMNFALLKSSIHRNCFEKRIHLANTALGTPAQAGTTMDMRVHVLSPSLSTLANASILENIDMTFDRNFEVRLTTIDSTLRLICSLRWIKRKEIISLLKIDVEGFEENVLLGASGLFDDRLLCFEKPRHVHIEIFPALLQAAGSNPAGPLEWLVSKGYALFVGLGDGLGGEKLVKTMAIRRKLLSIGCSHIYHETFAVPGESIGDLIQLMEEESTKHIDVLAQRFSPSLPPEIDARNSKSIFYAHRN